MTSEGVPTAKPAARTIGYWMAAPMALLQAVNAVRAFIAPQGFAEYMGAPLASASDASWVLVYGLRTAFIALLAGIFWLRRDVGALKWMALAALLMPIGDAWIAYGVGAAPATVARHGAIAVYVLIATVALFAADRRVDRRVAR